MMPSSDNALQLRPPKKHHPKRDDIQGLRAFAIFSVFVYHLKASWLPYGYLGVDM